ncbi:transposase, partial [Vibrio breoganii]|uniref:transposase n=1 Tax=Vibrio breoganii TaxID=553239 RepID=UPI0018E427F5
MGKARKKITNWAEYNKALCKRGSVGYWIDDSAVDVWRCKTHHRKRGRGFKYSDTAIESALMMKGIFSLPLRALQGFIDSIFELMEVPLTSLDYTCISKRSKTVQVKYRNRSRGAIRHIAIESGVFQVS